MKPAAHILVVDDEPEVLELFTKILKRGGAYSVTAVASGGAARKVLKEKHVDLMVLDLNMPRPDGLEVLKSVRAEMPGLRVLVVSGYLQGALLQASEILGATKSLNKAEAPKHLRSTVETLLR
jgi:two-component system response regulator ResD